MTDMTIKINDDTHIPIELPGKFNENIGRINILLH